MSALLDSFSILFFVAYHTQCIVQLCIQLYTLHAFKTLTTLNTPTNPQRFADVDRVLVSYFTFRALKETLTQIQETDVSPNKTEYKWLYEFASANNPNDSQAFIKALFAQRPDYGQRILAQRQSLFEQWEKSFMPASVGKIVEDQNLEHLRDQLFATVNLSEECLFTGDELECIPEKEKENEKVEAVRSKNNVVPVQDQLLTEAAELPDYGEPEIA